MSEERLRNDFDSCVTLYQDYIRQTSKSKTAANTVNISELKTGKRKFEQVEDRYYTKEEYASLTPDQKKELASKRTKRGHKPGDKDSKVVSKAKTKTTAKDVIHNIKKVVNRQVAQLAKQMSKTAVDDDTAGSTNSIASQECSGKCANGGNRSNPSLTRQKKSQTSDTKK
jgi:hypothetical protein